MIVREFEKSDMKQILALHRESSFDYEFPDLDSHLFDVKKVVTDPQGNIGMAAFLRRTHEAYLVCDKNWRTPKWRWDALRKLHEVVRDSAKEKMIEDVCLWMPSDIEKTFSKRLIALGWHRHVWPSFSVKV